MNLPQLQGNHKRNFYLGDQACESISAKQKNEVQSKKLESLRKAGQDDAVTAQFLEGSGYMRRQPGTTFKIDGVPFTREIPSKDGASAFGMVKAAGLSLLALVVGLLLLKLAHMFYVRVAGRLSDPIWIKG